MNNFQKKIKIFLKKLKKIKKNQKNVELTRGISLTPLISY